MDEVVGSTGRTIQVYDTTLRDGTQREGISLSGADKIRVAQRLDQLGFAFIEGGWPGSNPKDAEFFERARDLPWTTALIAAPQRLAVSPEVIRRTLDGRLRLAPDGRVRASDRYLLIGRRGASRPDPVQAAWAYAQMVRWGQAPLSQELLAATAEVFRPDLYDAAVGGSAGLPAGEPADDIGAFAGPAFDPHDIAAHLTAWPIRRG